MKRPHKECPRLRFPSGRPFRRLRNAFATSWLCLRGQAAKVPGANRLQPDYRSILTLCEWLVWRVEDGHHCRLPLFLASRVSTCVGKVLASDEIRRFGAPSHRWADCVSKLSYYIAALWRALKCAAFRAWVVVAFVRRGDLMKHLERLVSWHQFLCYPSEYVGFNRAYESAVAQLCGGTGVQELYIVQLATASRVHRREEHLQFSCVPSELISSHGPFFLTDICGMVRRTHWDQG
jgi:hypothetical protein